FLLVSAGRLAPWAGASAVRWTVIGLALVANLVHVEREHPFHASSVNALGGAPGSFYRLLDDSNQDWGQGLKALARWQRERDVPRITLLSSLLVDGADLLAAYGVAGEASVRNTRPLFFPPPAGGKPLRPAPISRRERPADARSAPSAAPRPPQRSSASADARGRPSAPKGR